MSFNFDDLFKGFAGSEILQKYPNFNKYPPSIQECLRLNIKMQKIGK